MKKQNLLVNMIFGSELYGTNSPSSDRDYKGVYMPSFEEAVNNNYKKSIVEQTKSGYENKNSQDDVDTEMYAIQRFLELGFMGETVFLDMIHNRHTILETSPMWEDLYSKRAMFYTRNMKSYIGYCRAQAAKYGIKGSRLADTKRIIEHLKQFGGDIKLNTAWNLIKESDNVKFITIGEERYLDVCGKSLQGKAKISFALETLEKFYNQYGERAILAMNNEGVDWKAVSHAFRAGYQLIEIMETGDLKYPLKEAEFLKDIKYGKLHYVNDKIGERLDLLIEKCIMLSDNSLLPETVDKDYWYKWLAEWYKKFY